MALLIIPYISTITHILIKGHYVVLEKKYTIRIVKFTVLLR